MELTPSTDLEALNEMLTSVGETPINSLEDASLLTDAAIARDLLRMTLREVQNHGWYFNTEPNLPLTVDAFGDLLIPADLLKVRTPPGSTLVPRGGRMFDRALSTYEFVPGTVAIVFAVRFIAFDDVPESCRRYVALRAARRFQQKVLGNASLDGYTERDEQNALAALRQEESEYDPANYCTDNFEVFTTWNR